MGLTEIQAAQVADFRNWLEGRLAGDERLGPPLRDDHEDGSTLTTRHRLGEDLYLEVALRPLIPQVRVGIVTDNRWKSEELEDAVESSGDTMAEFLEVAFAEAGLDWENPPVEHYRDQGRWFTFITPLALDDLQELADDALRAKTLQMIAGYLASYGRL